MTTQPTIYLEASIGAPSVPWLTLDDTLRGKLNTGKLAADYFSQGFYTDIASRAYNITARRGRQRLLDRAQAGTLSAELDNNDRALDPTNTAGAYVSGGVSLIQPMRIARLRAGWGYQYAKLPGSSSAYLSTPHTTANGISTDLYMEWAGIIKCNATTTQTLAAKYGTAGNRSWKLICAPSGSDLTFSLIWSTNGTATVSAAQATITNGARDLGYTQLYVYASLDLYEDAAGAYRNKITVYDSTGTVVASDSTTGGAATTLYNATSTPITLGAHNSGTDFLDGFMGFFSLYDRPPGDMLHTWFPGYDQYIGRKVSHFYAPWMVSATTAFDYYTGATWTLNGAITQVTPNVYDLWRGYVDEWLVGWDDPQDSRVVLTATDGFKILARVDNDASGAVGASELSGARITRLLDAAGWPTGDRWIDYGHTTVQATTLAQNALTELYLTSDTELGFVFMDQVGRFTFLDRWRRLTLRKQPIFTFGDADDDIELPYSDLVVSNNDDLVYNDISIARVGGSAQTTNDSTSISESLTRSFTRTDLIMETDAVAADYAGVILAESKDSDLRFDRLTISSSADDRLWPVMFSPLLGNRITVNRTPPGGGSRITRECFVEGVTYRIPQYGIVEVDLDLSDASVYAGFVLDDATLGQLDDDTLTF